MHDSRPIGVFDSGIGGLTVLKEIHHLLPNESTIYVGDTARVPYGNRSPHTIAQFSEDIASFLVQKNIKALVVACATASSVALATLTKKFPTLSILGVIKPTIHELFFNSFSTNTPHIAIIGTKTTIQSRSFEKEIIATALTKKSAVTSSAIACPLFVPLIEEGLTSGDILNQTIKHYLSPLKSKQPSHVILGCTHYPLITANLQAYLPKSIIVNPGIATAKALKILLQKKGLTATKSQATHSYYSTDITPTLNKQAQHFLGQSVTLKLTPL